VIINSYLTDGYFEWGKIFIKSYTHFNGEDDEMVIFTKDLKSDQIKELTSLRKNIEIRNSKIDYNDLSRKMGISKEKLMMFKNITENKKTNTGIKIWKNYIADDDRIKSIYSLIKEMDEGDNLFHADIDTCVTGSFERILKITKENDFSTIFRIDKQINRKGFVYRENRAVLMCVMGFTVNDKVKDFMDRWIYYIDKIPLQKRGKAHGQKACYQAYVDINKKYPNFKWGQMRSNNREWLNANKGLKSINLKKSYDYLKKNGVI